MDAVIQLSELPMVRLQYGVFAALCWQPTLLLVQFKLMLDHLLLRFWQHVGELSIAGLLLPPRTGVVTS